MSEHDDTTGTSGTDHPGSTGESGSTVDASTVDAAAEPLVLAGLEAEPRLPDARSLVTDGAPDRWRPVRAGILNIYGYQDQVFDFDDGLCLLRGRNGSGKSIAQSLLFPFLFDAQLGAGRMSHGRPTGSMKNLLLVRQGSEDDEDTSARFKYESRAGYVWATFVRPDPTGGPAAAITIGCGTRATKASDADSWFFVTTRQPGFDLELAPGGEPLSRLNLSLELGDALPPPVTTPPGEWGPAPTALPVRRAEGRRGRERVSSPCVFETREAYQSALDRALFGMGVERLRKAVDLILVLRRPQLGVSDADAISRALSDALAPLDSAAIERIASGFEDLDALRRRLAELEAASEAFARAAEPQRRYLRLAAAARATGVERARQSAQAARRKARQASVWAGQANDAAELAGTERERLREAAAAAHERRNGLLASPAYAELGNLQDLDGRIEDTDGELASADERIAELDSREEGLRDRHGRLTRERDTKVSALRDRLGLARSSAEAVSIPPSALGLPDASAAEGDLLAADAERWRSAVATVRQRESSIKQVLGLVEEATRTERAITEAQTRLSEEQDIVDDLDGRCDQAADGLEAVRDALGDEALMWWGRVAVAHASAGIEADPDGGERLAAVAAALEADASGWQRALTEAVARLREHLSDRTRELRGALGTNESEAAELAAARAEVEASRDLPPPRADWRDAAGPAARSLWQLVDPVEGLAPEVLDGIEAALAASGLLDLHLGVDGAPQSTAGTGTDAADVLADLVARVGVTVDGPSLAEVLVAAPDTDSGIHPAAVTAVLEAIAFAPAGADPDRDLWISEDGRFRIGPAVGSPRPAPARYLGAPARAAHRQHRLDEIDAALAALDQARERLEAELGVVADHQRDADGLERDGPNPGAVREAWQLLDRLQSQLDGARRRRDAAAEGLETARREAASARRRADDTARERDLPAVAERLEALVESTAGVVEVLLRAAGALEAAQGADRSVGDVAGQMRDLDVDLQRARSERSIKSTKLSGLRARREGILAALGADPDDIAAEVEAASTEASEADRLAGDADTTWSEATNQAATATAQAEAEKLLAETAETAYETALAAAESLRQPVLAAAFADQDGTARDQAPEPERDGRADDADGGATVLALAWPASASVTEIVEVVLREARDELAQVMAERGVAPDAPDLAERVTATAEAALQAANNRLQSDLVGDWYPTYVVSGGFREIRVGSTEAGETSLFEAVAEVRRKVEEHASRISADEQELFTNHLFRDAATEIRTRLQETDVFVEQVNTSLAGARTSSELSLSLRWEVSVDDPGARTVVQMMRQDPAQLSARSRELVRDHFLARIATLRGENPELSYAEVLPEVFDYRRWHHFTVRLHHPDGTAQIATRSVMKSLSGGEAANAIHQPLFAALDAHYRGADPAAPRMLALDEAFAGIDDSLRGSLMGLLVDWRFDALIASHEMWGTFAEVPALRIYDLRRMPPSEAVHAQEFRWNGRTLTGTVDAA